MIWWLSWLISLSTLSRQETPTEQLTALSLEDLTRLADELQAQVIKQR